METPHRTLIVDPRPAEVSAAARALRDLGCESSVVSTFEEAKQRLACGSDLSLIITAVRLREFNGVHLALHGRSRFPQARIVVTDYAFDPVIEREALKLGAEYLLKPLDPSSVAGLLAAYGARGPGGTRRWDRKALPAGSAAFVGGRSVRLIDVSYGGVRLEIPREIAEQLPHAVAVAMPVCGLQVDLHPVWSTCAADSDMCLCGAEFLAADQQTASRWQEYVDRS